MPLQFAELNARTEETPSRSKRDYRAIEKKKKRQTNEQTYDKSRGLTACRVSTNFNDTLRGRSRNRRGCSAPQISGANDVSVFVFRFDANSVLSCNCNDPARSRPLPPLPPPPSSPRENEGCTYHDTAEHRFQSPHRNSRVNHFP